MKAIYDKEIGEIIAVVPRHMDYRLIFIECEDNFVNSLDEILIDDILDYKELPSKYYVKDEMLIEYTEQEIEERRLYGKVLTEEERLLNKLKPSPEEVAEAEQIIKILTLIQEVV